MAKPNFKFQKRQKELEKKKKNEEKMQRRLERAGACSPENPEEATGEGLHGNTASNPAQAAASD
jgi:hypothetical protein